MNTYGLFGMLAGAAVAIALFLSSFFLFVKRKEHVHFTWIGLILLAISLRIGKSIFYFLYHDMAPVGLALGFLGLASIGPLSWFMINSTNRLSIKNFWHFIVPFFGAIGCFVIARSPYESVFYESATLLMLLYLFFAWHSLKNHSFDDWNKKVLVMVSGVWLALVYQHLSNTMMDYAVGAIIASIFIYWIFYQSFKSAILTSEVRITLPDNVVEQVKEAFEVNKFYKEPGMNLQAFSNRLDIPPYLVTRSVKTLYDKSYPETLNHFRIEEMKKMLLDSGKEHFKIESLAYEIGFASPSAFYVAFKKHTGQTPTAYQKEMLMSA